MKISEGRPLIWINPLKWVAAILIKKILKNKINDHQAIFLYNMAEQLPNLDIFKSVSTVTHGVYGIESDYNTITSGKERNSIDQPYSNTKNRFSKDSKK